MSSLRDLSEEEILLRHHKRIVCICGNESFSLHASPMFCVDCDERDHILTFCNNCKTHVCSKCRATLSTRQVWCAACRVVLLFNKASEHWCTREHNDLMRYYVSSTKFCASGLCATMSNCRWARVDETTRSMTHAAFCCHRCGGIALEGKDGARIPWC